MLICSAYTLLFVRSLQQHCCKTLRGVTTCTTWHKPCCCGVGAQLLVHAGRGGVAAHLACVQSGQAAYCQHCIAQILNPARL
jgi:hypothetical protein